MATLNLSQNGVPIQKSYQAIVDAPLASGSETYGQWAVYSVQAPLVSAFVDSGKESVLKVQTTGGEIICDDRHVGTDIPQRVSSPT